MSGCALTQMTFKSLNFCRLAKTDELETEWSPPRRRGLLSLQELCLAVISESLDSSEEVQELELPRALQHDLREVMDKF